MRSHALWKTWPLAALLLVAGCGTIPQQYVRQDHSNARAEEIEGSELYHLLPPGAIPALDRPTWTDVDTAAAFMEAQEPMIVYQQDGETRAYSTWQLNGHEVVNDVVGDTPIAVTW